MGRPEAGGRGPRGGGRRPREERSEGRRRPRPPGRAARWLRAAACAFALSLPLALAGACGERGTAADARGGGNEAAAEAGAAAPDTALARLLTELQPVVERAAGLEARREPRLAVATRARLQAFLAEQLEEQLPPERAEPLVAAYARFGLVPDTLDLIALLRSLYEEQVVGFYDPASDTLFVVEGVPEGQMEMVLAHELVHALQDQHVNLDSLTRALREHNDRATAAHAAIEGQATLAMLEWQMERLTGRPADVTRLPPLAERLAEMELGALGGEAGLPALGAAPRVIRETLIFPYVGGLGYVQALWRTHPDRPAPFGARLPASTREVMQAGSAPGSPPRPVELAFPGSLPPGWEEAHGDVLGALETRILLEERLGDAARARSVAGRWLGDRYRLLRGPEGEALVWATVWEGEAEADRAAAVLEAAWADRYGGPGRPAGDAAANGGPAAAGRSVRVARLALAGHPGVLLLDLPPGLEVDEGWPAARAEAGAWPEPGRVPERVGATAPR